MAQMNDNLSGPKNRSVMKYLLFTTFFYVSSCQPLPKS